MAADLADVWEEIRLADNQAIVLRAEIQHFLSDRPYLVWRDLSPQTGYATIKVRSLSTLPTTVIRSARQIVHSYRISLDYLATRLARRKNPGFTGKAYFPVSKRLSAFKIDGLDKLRVLRIEDERIIASFVPYGGDGGNKLLFALHHLNIGDKHNDPCLAGGVISNIGIISGYVGTVVSGPNVLFPLEEGATLLTVGPDTEVKFTFAAEIVFREVPGLPGIPIQNLLNEFSGLTKSIVACFD
jgi:hypothetical protein